MNTRQLSQGLVPTVEYERRHAFKSFRQFPELRLSAKEVEDLKLRQRHSHTISPSLRTPLILKSTHKLEELSKSSLEEVSSVMTDYRRILMENRRVNNNRSRAPTAAASEVEAAGSLSLSSLSSPPSPAPLQAMTRTSTMGSSFSAGVLPGSQSAQADPLSSLSPIERADMKLTKISISFDSQSYNSHWSGFQGAKLSKAEFETLLRRCLNIFLSKAELDALFTKMDVDKSGMIDGVEFIRYFFALGNSARWKMQLETVTIRAKKLENLKRRRQEDEARIKAWEAKQISKFSDQDRDTALQKLQQLSVTLDTLDELDSLVLRGFSALMTPYQFKIQLSKAFGLSLTSSEISALVAVFQTEPGELSVNGPQFLRRLQELRREHNKQLSSTMAILGEKKKKVMAMGQNVDFLPKQLGR